MESSAAAPRASVIIPAFNAETTISASIAAAQEQTEANIEIIVVDDASRDNTPEIVRRLAERDRRIALIRVEQNAGPGAARNLGLARARGNWIALLDADDSCLPERLTVLLSLGEARNADIVADNLLIIGGEIAGRKLLDDQTLASERWLSASEFVKGNMGDGSRSPKTFGFLKPVFRTSFLRAHELCFSAARFAEDYLFYRDCLICGGKWLLTPRAMYSYVQRHGSLTHSHSAEDLTYLAAAERQALADPAVRADPLLAEAIRRHCRSVELAASWFGFASAIKRRDLKAASVEWFRSWRSATHILAQGLRALPRVAGKARVGKGRPPLKNPR